MTRDTDSEYSSNLKKKSTTKRGIKQNLNVVFPKEEHVFSIYIKGNNQTIYISIGEINFKIKTNKKWTEYN